MAYTVLVEAAFGADLTADPSSWSWTDITAYVRYSPGISITRGRSDIYESTHPSTLTLTLDNTSGRFTPANPSSPYYPYVRRNTPLRVKVDGTSRGVFYVDAWPAQWSAYGREKHVSVNASGLLRRLARSARTDQDGNELRSALRRSIQADSTLRAYWPLEDASSSDSFAEVAGGGIAGAIYGEPQIAAESTLPGSAPLPTFPDSSGFRAVLVPAAAVTGWTVLVFARFEAETAFSNAAVLYVHTPAGSIKEWQIVISTGSPATVDLLGMTTPGDQSSDTLGMASVAFTGPDGAEMYGRWVAFEISVAQDGADLDWRFALIVPEQTQVTVGTETGATVGNITEIDTKHNQVGETSFGHLAVFDSYDATGHAEAMNGYAGEIPRVRIDRLCEEEGIPYAAVDSNAADEVLMGAQSAASVLSVLEEAASTGGGVLVERLSGKLGYVFAGDRYNSTAAMVLDYPSGDVQPGLELVEDDTHVRNDVTASRPGGSSARHTDNDHIAAQGRYDATVTVNPVADSDLPRYAEWAVHLGTVDDPRVSQLGINLARSSIADWLACDIWSRVQVTDPPSEAGPADLDLHIEGYTETITTRDWRVTLNTSPAAPWQIVELDGAGNLSRADTAGCTVLAPITAAGTDLLVATTSGPRWGTQQPFDLDLHLGGVPGERVTCTAKTDRTCTYVGAGTVVHGENVSLVPPYPTGLAPGDLLLCFAAIRDTAAEVGTPYRWTPLLDAGNVVLLGRLYDPSLEYYESFETDAGGFTGTDCTVARSTVRAHTGAASLLMTVTGTPVQAYARPALYPVTANARYYLSFWAYSVAGYADLNTAIDWYDSGGSYIGGEYGPGGAIGAATWTQRTISGVAPANAAYATPGPTLGSNPPNGTALWVDDIEFSESPTLDFFAGGTGDTVSAQVAAWRYAQCDTTFAQMQTNASAQNIAYPAASVDRDRSLVIYLGQKADDWTSVSSPGTEIDEPDTVTGDDQGLVWAHTIQTTATPITSGSFTVTGGAGAVSKGGVVVLPTDCQSLTLTRAVNDVSRAWGTDAAVRLWRPNVLGM